MVGKISRAGQRTKVRIGIGKQFSCIVWGDVVGGETWNLYVQLTAFEINCYRKLPTVVTCDSYTVGPVPHHVKVGRAVDSMIKAEEYVYALRNHLSRAVKIGRTADLRRRWAKLEMESGNLLQLVSIWRTANSRRLERQLHERWAAERRLGEWFADDLVLRDINDQVCRAPSAGLARLLGRGVTLSP
jgi:hypothetical protein